MELTGRADLHVHSCHSPDGFATVPQILAACRTRRIQVVALTDHNTMAGALEAVDLADHYGVEVIPGEEVDTDEGHLLALFLREPIEPGRPVAMVLREIRRQGGLAIVPHPMSPWDGFSAASLLRWAPEVDAVELFSPTYGGRLHRRKAVRLNRRHCGLPLAVGSDAHLLEHVGRSYTCFAGSSAAELRRCLEQGLTQRGGRAWSVVHHIHYLQQMHNRRVRGGAAAQASGWE